jgi:hypothetical protein
MAESKLVAPSGYKNAGRLTPQQMRGIISDAKLKTVSPRQLAMLRRHVANAWANFLADHCLPRKQGPAALRDNLAVAAKVADRLLKAFGIQPTSPYSDLLISMPRELRIALRREATTKQLDATIGGVKFLKVIASQAQERVSAHVTSGHARHKGDEHFTRFIGLLADGWLEVFEDVPGAGWNPYEGKSSGPFVRFVAATLKVIEVNLGESLLLSDQRLGRLLRSTPSALRQRIRRLGYSKLNRFLRDRTDHV